MKIFRDRIVLKDGNVIMPNEIHGITTNGVVYGIELHDGSYMVVAPNKIRTDRPTGMVDIYENSRVKYHYGDDRDVYGCEGTVVFKNGEFLIEWDDYTIQSLYSYDRDRLTITGMVPFGEDK